MKILLGIIASIIWLSGCAHVISKDILVDVDAKTTFAELRKDPKAHLEKLVLLGGVIVKTENKEDGTLLEIYQTEMDSTGRPINVDKSGGRFLAFSKEYLDSEIYRKGRMVTIAGLVQGEQIMKLGELDYHYPYLIIKELHLWEEERPHRYEPYPRRPLYPWGWYPWYPWYSWYDPFWYSPYYRR